MVLTSDSQIGIIEVCCSKLRCVLYQVDYHIAHTDENRCDRYVNESHMLIMRVLFTSQLWSELWSSHVLSISMSDNQRRTTGYHTCLFNWKTRNVSRDILLALQQTTWISRNAKWQLIWVMTTDLQNMLNGIQFLSISLMFPHCEKVSLTASIVLFWTAGRTPLALVVDF